MRILIKRECEERRANGDGEKDKCKSETDIFIMKHYRTFPSIRLDVQNHPTKAIKLFLPSPRVSRGSPVYLPFNICRS
jgi:hypothetical protein